MAGFDGKGGIKALLEPATVGADAGVVEATMVGLYAKQQVGFEHVGDAR